MADSNNHAGPSKAIASLAKKPTDTTRMGTQKLKFVPTLPSRRKKEEVKQEPAAAPAPAAESGRGRGRGGERGRGRGRGAEGRGAAPRPPAVEMTASGPFAMGPALAGTSAKRTIPRANYTPVAPQGPGGASNLGAGLTKTTAPSLSVKREGENGSLREKGKQKEEDEGEVYSDPDEGVEIVDMQNIGTMDWMAPESLKKEREDKKKKKVLRVKQEPDKKDTKGKGVATPGTMDVDQEDGEVNLANAVDLSESEEEEELEDIIEDFAFAQDVSEDTDMRQERLYFFQFPRPFPTFLSRSTAQPSDSVMDVAQEDGGKKVTFSEDTKPAAEAATPKIKKEESEGQLPVDGIVGQLEIYQSGAIKMRLTNGTLLEVTAATQPSFLQHAVYLDSTNKRLCVLGEVNRRFVLSPDLETLLESMERAERPPPPELESEELISMDTT